jgi:hypothetical protein
MILVPLFDLKLLEKSLLRRLQELQIGGTSRPLGQVGHAHQEPEKWRIFGCNGAVIAAVRLDRPDGRNTD